jgi:hypothetical protein
MVRRALVLGGMLTISDACPLEQGTVAGNPGSCRLDENSQLTALVTVASSVTTPPEALSTFGDAVKE